jgi:hypothetical protein
MALVPSDFGDGVTEGNQFAFEIPVSRDESKVSEGSIHHDGDDEGNVLMAKMAPSSNVHKALDICACGIEAMSSGSSIMNGVNISYLISYRYAPGELAV